jgi:hypothetical protein
MKAKILIITVISLLLLSIVTPALAESPTPVVSSGTSGEGSTTGGFGSPDVLWNQPTRLDNAVASQYFTNYGYGWYSADDFSNTDPLHIVSIFVDGMTDITGMLTNADSLHWFIYADASGIPAGNPTSGGHLWSHTCLPGDPEVSISGVDGADSTLDIVMAQGGPLYLPPGTYWLCFYPAMNFHLYGQWYWEIANTSNLSIAQFIDPNGATGYTSWTPWTTVSGDGTAHDAAFSLDGGVGTQPPSNLKYLHCTDGLFDLSDPLNTQWHELLPFFSREFHLCMWEDNGDGELSYCDDIEMYRKPDGPPKPYHVEDVTITLYVTPETGDGDPMYIELVGGYNSTVLQNPWRTQWHEVYPIYSRSYTVVDWIDNTSGELDFCDYLILEDEWHIEPTSWHVEEVAVDIVVDPQPWPVGGEAYPVNWTTIILPSIVGMLVITGVLLIFRHRKVKA